MGLNQAKMLHEATQKGLGGSWVLVQVQNASAGQQCAKRVIESLASTFLDSGFPIVSNRDGLQWGWDVQFRSKGLLHFASTSLELYRSFQHVFLIAPMETTQKEILASNPYAVIFPTMWDYGSPLVCKPVYVPSRYERVLANVGG